jgi:hypothetical protein
MKMLCELRTKLEHEADDSLDLDNDESTGGIEDIDLTDF